jgi:hypothetical protein
MITATYDLEVSGRAQRFWRKTGCIVLSCAEDGITGEAIRAENLEKLSRMSWHEFRTRLGQELESAPSMVFTGQVCYAARHWN